MLVVVDYGVGNLGSVANMLRKIGAKAEVSSDPVRIEAATSILLPGVGRFDHAMQCLNDSGLVEPLRRKALEEKVPILGICLGAQMLGRSSEEGKLPGLGWLDMEAKRFPAESGLRVPHMGWRVLGPCRPSPLFEADTEERRYYFAHSYYMAPDRDEDIIAKLDYGLEFAACVGYRNIYGAQFHPEKSHRFGAAFLKNFVERG